MLWVAQEEFTEDIQKIGGTEAFDHPYLETPFFQLIRKRVGWLIITFSQRNVNRHGDGIL